MTKGLIGAVAGLIGLMVYFIWQGIESKSLADGRLREIHRLEWQLIKIQAEKDTIFIPGQYSVDTLHRTVLVHDTVYEDIPDIVDKVSFDTVSCWQPGDAELCIRVSGQFYFPQEYAYRNWLQIVPDLKLPLVMPVEARPKKMALGLTLGVQVPWRASVGVLGRFNHWSLTISRQVNMNTWGAGLSYEILRF